MRRLAQYYAEARECQAKHSRVLTRLTDENARLFVDQNDYESVVYIFLIKD
jgi:hypothetical protein